MLTAADLNPPEDTVAFCSYFWSELSDCPEYDNADEKTLKMRSFAEERVYGHAFKQPAYCSAYVHVYLFVELKGAARTEHYAECRGDALFGNSVLLCLLYGGNASNGVVYVHVYGTLAAPWAAVYYGSTVCVNPYYGVVVVYECGAAYVLCPHVAVGALSSAACAKEHVCLAVVLHHR